MKLNWMLQLNIFLAFLCSFRWIYVTGDASSNTLKLVHLIYRHGDRSPMHTYPTDPYQEDSWPEGWGQLTQVGMRQHYELGTYFRQKYFKGFLNGTYLRDQIKVRSTCKDRTLMSAYSHLAGLYPPSGSQLWNPGIKWQPIPVQTRPLTEDMLLSTDPYCPKWTALWKKAIASDRAKKLIAENKEYIGNASRHAGYNTSSLNNVWTIFGSVKCERAHNWTLPGWITDDMYNKLLEMYREKFEFANFNKEMCRLRGGVFLNELGTHLQQKRDGKMDAKMRVFMYSSHDTTVATILAALGIYNHKPPPYTATAIFELHEMKAGDWRVKILYKNETGVDPYVLKLPECDEVCPLDRFIELSKPLWIPMEDWHNQCAVSIFHMFHLSTMTMIVIGLAGLMGIMVVVFTILLVKWKKKSRRYAQFTDIET